jgi:hypothetical protein
VRSESKLREEDERKKSLKGKEGLHFEWFKGV